MTTSSIYFAVAYFCRHCSPYWLLEMKGSSCCFQSTQLVKERQAVNSFRAWPLTDLAGKLLFTAAKNATKRRENLRTKAKVSISEVSTPFVSSTVLKILISSPAKQVGRDKKGEYSANRKLPHTVSSFWCHREAELLYWANLSNLSPEPAECNACVLRQEDSFPCKCGLLIPAGIDFLGPGRRKDSISEQKKRQIFYFTFLFIEGRLEMLGLSETNGRCG